MVEKPTNPEEGSPPAAGVPAPKPGGNPPVSPSLTTVPMAGIKPWNISGSREVKPVKPKVTQLDHIQVGYTLAKIFAGILAGYLILALISITYSESRTLEKMDALTKGMTIGQITSAIDQTNAIKKEEVEALTKSVAEAYRDTRATTIEFHKTVIINVQFPILTALLGYIFANRAKTYPDRNGK